MTPSANLKIKNWSQARELVQLWKQQEKEVVFTNGCFDILHMGHIKFLEEAAALGDRLVIGVNSDASTSRLKGSHRPINEEGSRLYLLASLSFVDCVVAFDEETPFALIEQLVPDILVKGGDYQVDQIVGADIVIQNGGKVKSLQYLEGFSTSKIESKILSLHRFKSSEESE